MSPSPRLVETHVGDRMSYGSKPTGGYNDASKNYKNNPTIENYIRLRAEQPDAEIEVAVHGGIDQLFFMEPILKGHGINPASMAAVLDADPDAISELSLFFMKAIVVSRAKRKAGETHTSRRGVTIPDKLIDWFITTALDAMSWTDDLEINRDLIVLIRERLGGALPEYEKAAQVHQKKQNASIIAGQLAARGITPSLRMIAGFMDVAPSTVKRWFGPGELEHETERYKQWFDEEGNLKPLLASRPLQAK
jgi:hypothetical protein